ncbi:MAG: hypothetical protein N4A68_14800 [Maledivibacter sp.]|nr:hypothetical protein [Maledivibacter sp.]
MITFLLKSVFAGIITHIVLNYVNGILKFKEKIYDKINDIILTKIVLAFTLVVLFSILVGGATVTISFFLSYNL